MRFKHTLLALALAGASFGAQATPVTTGGVFAMSFGLGLDQATTVPPSTGSMGTFNITGFVDQAAGTWGVASTSPFFGANWTASGGKLITAPGNYALNTTTDTVAAAAPDTVGTADGMMHFTVGANQVAGTINFAWSGNTGIRVVDVWNVNSDGSLTAVAAPGMENGPFPGKNAAFELTTPGVYTAAAPVPEASTYGMMVVGLGLVGAAVMRRRKV